MHPNPMQFQTSTPVTGEAFFDREDELRRLGEAIRDIRRGVPRYCAVLGSRKIGKSSLLSELKRRSEEVQNVVIVLIDCYESAVDAVTFFEDLMVATIDEFLLKTGRTSETDLLGGAREDDLRFGAAVGRIQALGVPSLSAACETLLGIRAGGGRHRERFRAAADLPESLGSDTGLKFVVIFDEFQECAKLNEFKLVKEAVGDVFAFLRARWQRHRNVCYYLSGSEITLLQKIIQSETSPFFQHFSTLTLEPFDRANAAALCRELFAASGRTLPGSLVNQLIDFTAGHPFYLQVLGEELCARAKGPKIPSPLFKEVVQDVLFANAGRLWLYFSAYFERHVKSSTSLAKTLSALAAGNRRVTDIARELGQATGVVSSWLSRLLDMDLIGKSPDGYVFRDPTFELWIRGTRTHERAAIAPSLLGDQAEKAVASKLAAEGFRLVYQSRASRGAFDLLAILNSHQVGLQVKKSKKSTCYISRTEHDRMVEWGKRLGWKPILCLYANDGEILFFSLGRLVSTSRGFRADPAQGSTSLLALLSA
jgi:Holliday junction resolvase/AAA+ ATPase superfamily predicted ATPase